MNVSDTAGKAPSVLLGDLLVKARLIQMQDLANAVPYARKTGLPIGRILIGSGAIIESSLQAALFAQSLVRDRLLDEKLACEALQIVDRDTCSFDNALANLGWRTDPYGLTNRLGDLLLEAGIITQSQLKLVLESSFSTGFPLARVLVLQGMISGTLASTALTTQKLLRDGEISRTEATFALVQAHEENSSLQDTLNYHGSVGPESISSIRIGELLLLANIIDEIALFDGIKRSSTSGQLLGETMVEDGKLPQYMLSNALELQHMAKTGELEPSMAVEALRKICATGMTVGEAVNELTAPSSLTELLGLPALIESDSDSWKNEPLQQQTYTDLGKELNSLPQEFRELITQHLELIERLSLRNESLSREVGYLQGKLAAYQECLGKEAELETEE